MKYPFPIEGHNKQLLEEKKAVLIGINEGFAIAAREVLSLRKVAETLPPIIAALEKRGADGTDLKALIELAARREQGPLLKRLIEEKESAMDAMRLEAITEVEFASDLLKLFFEELYNDFVAKLVQDLRPAYANDDWALIAAQQSPAAQYVRGFAYNVPYKISRDSALQTVLDELGLMVLTIERFLIGADVIVDFSEMDKHRVEMEAAARERRKAADESRAELMKNLAALQTAPMPLSGAALQVPSVVG